MSDSIHHGRRTDCSFCKSRQQSIDVGTLHPKVPRCLILGGGGHAKVVIDCLLENAAVVLCGILDADPLLTGSSIFGVPVLGTDAMLDRIASLRIDSFVVGVGGARDTSARRRLFQAGLTAGLQPLSVIHPSATRSTRCRLGAGCQILAGAIINASAVLGRNVLINSGAIVEHDCSIADDVHIAPGARLAGQVQIGSGAYIGSGAVIRQGIVVESRAIVGAGAVVVHRVATGNCVVGVPARPLVYRAGV